MRVYGEPLALVYCFQFVGCGAELSRMKAILLVKKGYVVPYHRGYVRE